MANKVNKQSKKLLDGWNTIIMQPIIREKQAQSRGYNKY